MIDQNEKPLSVQRCTTHHHACNCREWSNNELIRELKQEIADLRTLLRNEREINNNKAFLPF